MGQGFKFIRRNNKFCWENELYRVEFSTPNSQGYDDYATIKSIDNILYFYYSMKIYKKAYSYIEKETPNGIEEVKNEYWKLIGKTHTHDFPCVGQLEQIITYLLDCDVTQQGEKHTYQSGNVFYSKHSWTEGFGCDDFYELTKFTNEKSKESYYILYVGVSSCPMGSIESEGIRIPYLSKKDIKALLKCIKEFFKYTIYLHNKQMKKAKKCANESYEIVENKLYKYIVDSYKEMIINKNRLGHIYAIGDELSSITEYIVNEDGTFYSKEHSNCYIRGFVDNKILLEHKYDYDEDFDEEEYPKCFEIEVTNIAYLCNEVSKEMLQYTQETVANDFYNIMSNIEKLDFMTLSNEELIKKYKEAIIGRTWLCREEHNFEKEYSKYVKGFEDIGINHIVYEIIEMIKTYDLTLKNI